MTIQRAASSTPRREPEEEKLSAQEILDKTKNGIIGSPEKDENDNGSKIDELLKNIKNGESINKQEIKDLYSQITVELNDDKDSSIQDSSLRKVANVLYKLGKINNSGATANIDFKAFISELGKEYKPNLDEIKNRLTDGEPEIIQLSEGKLDPRIIEAAYKDALHSFGTSNIQIKLQGNTLFVYDASEEYPYNKNDIDNLLKDAGITPSKNPQ